MFLNNEEARLTSLFLVKHSFHYFQETREGQIPKTANRKWKLELFKIWLYFFLQHNHCFMLFLQEMSINVDYSKDIHCRMKHLCISKWCSCKQKLRKSRGKNLRTITKTHYAKRSRAGDDFRKWVEIKGFANVQDLMNVDSISDVLPLVTEAQTKNIGLFKHMQELVKV